MLAKVGSTAGDTIDTGREVVSGSRKRDSAHKSTRAGVVGFLFVSLCILGSAEQLP
jgi:hypothetical protein